VQIHGAPIAQLGIDERLEALKSSPLQVMVVRGATSVPLTMALE
jgi:hypothetical protein